MIQQFWYLSNELKTYVRINPAHFVYMLIVASFRIEKLRSIKN